MPIDDLPNEILQLIFKSLVGPPVPLLVTPPCRVAEVCRLWRSQALLVPGIFNILPSISLTFGNEVPRRLLLTAGRPLSFVLNGVCRLHKDNPNFKRIVNSSATWEHAELLGLEPYFSIGPLEGFNHGFPRLHTLKLQVHDTTGHVYAGKIEVFEHARSLRHLQLECSGALVFKAPYEQLVEYVERSSIAIAIRTVLSPVSQVQSLSFGSLHPLPLPYNINLPLMEEVTRLTSLNLYLQPETVKVLLCRLTLPSLTRLRVASSSPSILGDVTALVSRSECPLETLSLRILEAGMYWNLIASNTEMVSHVPLLNLCPQLRKLELDRLEFHTIRDILYPPSQTFLPQLQEFITHLPSAPPGRLDFPFDNPNEDRGNAMASPLTELLRPGESVAVYGDGGSARRVRFVRLVFRSAEHRAMAHLRMEPEGAFIFTEPLTLDPRLMETTRFLSLPSLSHPHTGRWWWHAFSVFNEPSTSSRLHQALSYLESDSPSVHDAWQILLSRVYIPLDQLLQASSEPASLTGARQRVVAILQNFDDLFKHMSIEWKSENEVTLVRMGPSAPPTVRTLVDAEKVYPGAKPTPSTPPWGFVDLAKHIGSAD